jgi:hypothetical protein
MTIPAAMRERLKDLIPAGLPTGHQTQPTIGRRERPVKHKMAPAPGGGRTGTIYDHTTTRDQARTTQAKKFKGVQSNELNAMEAQCPYYRLR